LGIAGSSVVGMGRMSDSLTLSHSLTHRRTANTILTPPRMRRPGDGRMRRKLMYHSALRRLKTLPTGCFPNSYPKNERMYITQNHYRFPKFMQTHRVIVKKLLGSPVTSVFRIDERVEMATNSKPQPRTHKPRMRHIRCLGRDSTGN